MTHDASMSRTVSNELPEVMNRLLQTDSVQNETSEVPVLEGPDQTDGDHGLSRHVHALG